MNLNEAKMLLLACKKYELRDRAFGDVEVTWTRGNEIVADGYFGTTADVMVTDENGVQHVFEGDEAHQLRASFASEEVGRNDMVGPEEFELGKIMPGLTKEGVLEEITKERTDLK